jgi:hypothetical protein
MLLGGSYRSLKLANGPMNSHSNSLGTSVALNIEAELSSEKAGGLNPLTEAIPEQQLISFHTCMRRKTIRGNTSGNTLPPYWNGGQ